MKRERFSVEQIVAVLKQAELGKLVAEFSSRLSRCTLARIAPGVAGIACRLAVRFQLRFELPLLGSFGGNTSLFFLARLFATRRPRRLTMAAVAERALTSRSTLQKIEAGATSLGIGI